MIFLKINTESESEEIISRNSFWSINAEASYGAKIYDIGVDCLKNNVIM